MRRRTFITHSAVLGAASFLPAALLKAQKSKGILVGLQLYSVRADMKADPKGTLEKLAAMGYKNVEHANYIDHRFYGFTASDFKKLLDGLGLQMPSGHTVMNAQHWDAGKKDFTDAWKKTVDDAALVGQKIVISPSMGEGTRKDYEALIRFLDVFNECGRLCQKHGMTFGYHNHDFEFKEQLNGTPMYDILLQRTDRNLVSQQLDIGNMFGGGAMAADYINRYPGRFVSLHVKDVIPAKDRPFENCLLGKGLVGVAEVLKLAIKKGGSEHLIIEQEEYQDKTPLQAMKEDLDIMRKWGYR